ncbi:hypothetical protein BC941DRAFT_476427 [Chlamydoabsidia padenii]|nr:hypothetical protein BC941DRAFT_476427 [Chlamydoabsidia padenii]
MGDQQPTACKLPLTILSSTDPAIQDLIEVWQQKVIAECVWVSGNKEVTWYELDAMFGHNTFLIDRVSVGGAIKGHLESRI